MSDSGHDTTSLIGVPGIADGKGAVGEGRETVSAGDSVEERTLAGTTVVDVRVASRVILTVLCTSATAVTVFTCVILSVNDVNWMSESS